MMSAVCVRRCPSLRRLSCSMKSNRWIPGIGSKLTCFVWPMQTIQLVRGYSSNGEWIDSAGFDAGTSFAFKLHRDRLIDLTTFVKQRRDLLMAHDSGIVYS